MKPIRELAILVPAFAGMTVLCLGWPQPAGAKVVIDPVTHYQTYTPDPSQWQPVPAQDLRPPTFPRPTLYPLPPPRLQTTCYVIGNIITCE